MSKKNVNIGPLIVSEAFRVVICSLMKEQSMLTVQEFDGPRAESSVGNSPLDKSC